MMRAKGDGVALSRTKPIVNAVEVDDNEKVEVWIIHVSFEVERQDALVLSCALIYVARHVRVDMFLPRRNLVEARKPGYRD